MPREILPSADEFAERAARGAIVAFDNDGTVVLISIGYIDERGVQRSLLRQETADSSHSRTRSVSTKP